MIFLFEIFCLCVCVIFKAQKPKVMVRSFYSCREWVKTLNSSCSKHCAMMQNHYLAFISEIPQSSWPPSSHIIRPPLVRGVEWWFQARLFLEQIQFAFALFLPALALYGWCSTFQEVSGPQCRKGRGCLAGLIRRQPVLRGTWNSWPGLPGRCLARTSSNAWAHRESAAGNGVLPGPMPDLETACWHRVRKNWGRDWEWGARSWTNRSSSWQTPQRALGLRLTLARGSSI